jgi:hypothetical protein
MGFPVVHGTHDPSVSDSLPQPMGQDLRNKPIAFVKAGATPSTKSRRKGKTPYRSGNTTKVYSPWDDHFSDIGDNHALCDKDCGWCGHCADYVDF